MVTSVMFIHGDIRVERTIYTKLISVCFTVNNSYFRCTRSCTMPHRGLTNATAKFDHVMYADDTTLISTLENVGPTNNAKELEQNINDEISKVATWLQCNKLKLNV